MTATNKKLAALAVLVGAGVGTGIFVSKRGQPAAPDLSKDTNYTRIIGMGNNGQLYTNWVRKTK